MTEGSSVVVSHKRCLGHIRTVATCCYETRIATDVERSTACTICSCCLLQVRNFIAIEDDVVITLVVIDAKTNVDSPPTCDIDRPAECVILVRLVRICLHRSWRVQFIAHNDECTIGSDDCISPDRRIENAILRKGQLPHTAQINCQSAIIKVLAIGILQFIDRAIIEVVVCTNIVGAVGRIVTPRWWEER
ncbi:hypothetical protein HRbin20_01545 [bacterium HR20]|nr:hypothetical protein HRbin20_01545 [bacterium HR20]